VDVLEDVLVAVDTDDVVATAVTLDDDVDVVVRDDCDEEVDVVVDSEVKLVEDVVDVVVVYTSEVETCCNSRSLTPRAASRPAERISPVAGGSTATAMIKVTTQARLIHPDEA